jgi:hypothetical protein
VLALASLLLASFAQSTAPATTPPPRRLAERFVSLATSEKTALNTEPNFLAEALIRTNPDREAEARQVADQAQDCITGDRGKASMRQAAVEAALRFSDEQLQRLISFAEMRTAQLNAGGSNEVPPEWKPVRKDYGQWMYSIPAQPAAVTLLKRCSDETAKRIAAAGLRN